MGCLCPVRHIDELETWEVGGGKVLIWDKQVLIYFLKNLYFQVQKQYFLERMKVALLRVLYQTSSSASPDCRSL